MATVKIRRRKLKIKTIICFLGIIVLVVYLGFELFNHTLNNNIKNIFVIGNEILTDDDVMELAKIENYPQFLSISSNEMQRRIKTSPFIKEVDVKKRLGRKVYIYIKEYEPLFYNKTTNKLVINNKEIAKEENFNSIPLLISPVDDEKVYKKLIERFSKVDNNIKIKISEIKYEPNEVDKERFLLSMNDGNYVYFTLNKIEEINYYMDILKTLEDKKGILYLDSGKYFEIFK